MTKTTGPKMYQEESESTSGAVDTSELLENAGEIRGYCEGKVIEGQHTSVAKSVADTRGYSKDPYAMPPSQNMPWERPSFKSSVTPDEENLEMTDSDEELASMEMVASQELGTIPVVTDPRGIKTALKTNTRKV